MQAEPVILVASEIDKEQGVVTEVIDDGFDAAIIEEVGSGETAAGTGFGEARARCLA